MTLGGSDNFDWQNASEEEYGLEIMLRFYDLINCLDECADEASRNWITRLWRKETTP